MRLGYNVCMDRRKRMISKRRTKQRKVDDGLSLSRSSDQTWATGGKLVFKPGSACIAGCWFPKGHNKAKDQQVEEPSAPGDQP